MHWINFFLLVLDVDDYVILDSADKWKKRYNIPDTHCFANKPTTGYNIFSGTSLAKCDLNSKLIIVSHGRPHEIKFGGQGYRPDDLAYFLKSLGLISIGLISFKACYLGQQKFLEDFIYYLSISPKVRIGWTIGYLDSTETTDDAHELVGTIEQCSRNYLPYSWFSKSNDSLRIKKIIGNTMIHNSGRRFNNTDSLV